MWKQWNSLIQKFLSNLTIHQSINRTIFNTSSLSIQRGLGTFLEESPSPIRGDEDTTIVFGDSNSSLLAFTILQHGWTN